MRVVFRPPTISDLDVLARTMRPIDVKECTIVAGGTPRQALQECVDGAAEATIAEIDGQIVCLFGWSQASFLEDEGYPWMLCAEGIEKHWRVLLTVTPRFLGEMRRRCEHLSNVVHADNRAAIRFLKWCGFEFGDLFMLNGEPFVHFHWTRDRAREAA